MDEIPDSLECYNLMIKEIVGFHAEIINEVIELPADEGATKFSCQISDNVGFIVFSFSFLFLMMNILDG